MKEQTIKAMGAHLLQSVLILLAFLAVYVIPCALAQRAGNTLFAPEGGCPGPWQLVADMPVELVGAAGASDGTFSYHAGGFNFTSGTQDILNGYDPATDTWIPLASMLQATAAASAVYYPPNNKIYVFGGVNPDSGIVYDTTQIYDIASNTWSFGTSMPGVRFAMASGYNSNNGKIYLVSGFSAYSASSAEADTWEYDPVADTFTSKTDFPHPAGGTASGVINGHLYVAGGRDAVNVVLDLVWDYDIGTDTWTQRNNMPSGENYAPGSAVALNNLWVFGGGSTDVPPPPGSDSAEAVFASTNAAFSLPVGKPEGPIPDVVNTAMRYDPANDTWSIIPDMNVLRAFPSGTAIQNKLIAAGGFTGNSFVPSGEVLDACIQGHRPSPTPRPHPTPRLRPTPP
jgi:hypothetical protein